MGHPGASATGSATASTGRESRVARRQRPRPQPLTAPHRQRDDQGMNQQGEREAAVTAPLVGKAEPKGNRSSRKVLEHGRATAGER